MTSTAVRPTELLRWGPWTFQPDNLTLRYTRRERNVHYDYEVDLEECRSAGAVVGWIAHLAGKRWCSDADLGLFVRALDDLLDLYRTRATIGAKDLRAIAEWGAKETRAHRRWDAEMAGRDVFGHVEWQRLDEILAEEGVRA